MPASSKVINLTIAAVEAVMLITGCASVESYGDNRVTLVDQITGDPQAVAIANLIPVVTGGRADGRVTFSQYGAIVVVRVNVAGLEANREYGIHVHEKGDCRGGASAAGIGGHFNPGGKAHGRPGRDSSHAGDLPNLLAGGEGNASFAFQTRAITVTEGPASVIGRSVVVSRNKDDYQTQPDGNSGPPVACGFIRPG